MKCIARKSLSVIKYGKTACGNQLCKCKDCGRRFRLEYARNSFTVSDRRLGLHLMEGLSIRSIARLLGISTITVISRIKLIARKTKRPFNLVSGKEYEIDEMATYIGNKKRRIWITYAIRKDTREVVDFVVGSRSKRTMSRVTETVILSRPRKIYTDRYINYKELIPASLHNSSKTKINRIERYNLNLRKDLKRLGRKTICFSKSKLMLVACLAIYFWTIP